MLQTAQRQSKTKKPKPASPHERFLEAFRWMLLTRTLEEKLVSLYRQGPGSCERGVRHVFEKERYLRTVNSRPGRTIRIRRTAVGRHPHLSGLAPLPNARARPQHPPRSTTGETPRSC